VTGPVLAGDFCSAELLWRFWPFPARMGFNLLPDFPENDTTILVGSHDFYTQGIGATHHSIGAPVGVCGIPPARRRTRQ